MVNLSKLKNNSISVVGLGYVGLPLAIEFSKKFNVLGFDINEQRIDELSTGYDRTREFTKKELESCPNLRLSCSIKDLQYSNIYIITVPTPIDKSNKPDLRPLQSASELVGKFISKGDVIIFESTVYPGCTEELCAPILEQVSGLEFNKDFSCGYSPERINPGDKNKKISEIVKVTSGSNKKTSESVDNLYKSIIKAGTFKAKSMKVAEAAKVIENTQRDLNIALMNELSMIFRKLDINTRDVLDAALTKWNFLDFKPGLVGGHCIGVDPYYLTHKAQLIGYEPKVILSGREVNDSMGRKIAEMIVEEMLLKKIKIKGSRILIMGLSFKENCPDIRNTKVIDLKEALEAYGAKIDLHDPQVIPSEAKKEYNIKVNPKLDFKKKFHAMIFAVEHKEFKSLKKLDLDALLLKKNVVFDIKKTFDSNFVDSNL